MTDFLIRDAGDGTNEFTNSSNVQQNLLTGINPTKEQKSVSGRN